MTTEHDLDARVQAARGLREDDLPALSEAFLDYLHTSADADLSATENITGSAPAGGVAGPAPTEDPASVLAARQLVADARQRRLDTATVRGRRTRRRLMLRAGGALLAVAAAGITAIVVTAPDTDRSSTASPGPTSGQTQPAGPVDPPGGLALVAAETITFPYSLDPTPPGLTPVLSKSGGLAPSGGVVDPDVWTATYQSASDAGFTFAISSQSLHDTGDGTSVEERYPGDVRETRSVTVNGVQAEFVHGTYARPECNYGPSSPAQTEEPKELCSNSFAELSWQRPDGQWAYVWSKGDTYSNVAALVSVAKSIVDRPQPVRLQVGLSPQGWAVSSYENGALTLISDTDPSIVNRIGISLQERWRGYNRPADVLKGMTAGNPVQDVTVQGRPAKLVSVPDPFTGPGNPGREQPRRKWYLAAQLPDGALYLLEAPDTLSQDDVLAIADQVTYSG